MPAAHDAASDRIDPFPFGIPLDNFASPLPHKISTSKWLSNNGNGELDDSMRPTRLSSSSRLAEEIPSDLARITRRGSAGSPRPSDGYGSTTSQPARVTRQRSSLPDHKIEIPRALRARKAALDDDDDEAEYQEEEDIDGEGEPDLDVEMDEEPVRPSASTARKTRRIADSDDEELEVRVPDKVATVSTRGRAVMRPAQYASDEESFEDDDVKPKKSLSRGRPKDDAFVEHDEEYDANEEEDEGYGGGGRRSSRSHGRSGASGRRSTRSSNRQTGNGNGNGPTRRPRKIDAAYESGTPESTTEDDDMMMNDDDDDDDDDDMVVKKKDYKLRQRQKKVNYLIPPADAYDMPISKNDKGKGKSRRGPGSWMPANMSGAQYAALYPEKARDGSDSDDDGPHLSTPRKAALFRSSVAAAAAGFGPGGGGMLAGGGGIDGAPNNLGKVLNAATLADTDPLGVASNISFDSVGGLSSHIQQLKEMVSLPLLYPEVFERFNITPPRGVLFHGPPGTGKTLLARALASSCSTEGRKISFFMRKGADCLSKWVGEAERQLRLLFEEAKACQPSIIFFDEIDGLAPVRSSKQDQIHASIVSTLLALMDGMDGRGQVIVIGATNRPDAIDPALRRPGRFDREFYFPLPNLEARRKILDIHTSGWVPPIEESFKDELAGITKGYGGADLRALCTEAALNAVQRTYPQIYKTNERLVIEPKTIDVTARDFIVSQKNLIPSTARATSSSAAPIPTQLLPLLAEAFEGAKTALSRVLPDVKKPNVLEEAEWEDDGGGFEKEKMMQAFETLRVFRPRMLVCGEPGMGQSYVGAAILHHLEGFHVQSLDLATLVSDSGRTMEAACVQLFVEAKRHKPSILFIPSLLTWVQTVNDTVRMTIKGLLEGLEPSDPILLLAVVDGPLSDLPSDVRAWFGFGKGNRITMTAPQLSQRSAFFAEVIAGIERPPNEFPDAMPRRKRVLAVLPIAPPPPPRVPTALEIIQLQAADQKLMEYLKWKLGPVLNELKKRYKKFTRSVWDEWRVDDLKVRQRQEATSEPIVGFGGDNPYYNVDLDTMHMDLYKGLYTTPDAFLEDISFIENNAEIEGDPDSIVKAGQMTNHSKVMLDQTFDDAFRTDCARMAERAAEREKNRPTESKKGKEKEIARATAAVNALDRTRHPHEGIATEGERILKRVRIEGEDADTDAEGEHDEGNPAKRARGEDDGGIGFGGGLANLLAPPPPTNLLPHEIYQRSLGINGSSGSNGGTSSFSHLLDPSPPGTAAGSNGPYTAGGASGIFSFADDPTPVMSPSSAFYTGPTSIVNPPIFPSVVPSLSTPLLAGPNPTAAIQPAYRPASTLVGVEVPAQPFASAPETAPVDSIMAASTDAIPAPTPPVVEPVVAPVAEPTPPPVDPPTPEPLPDFVLTPHSLDAFKTFLSDGTAPLNVDQLEQLRAACYDAIWRGRKEWDRDALVEELIVLSREFVEEVEECNAGEM